MADEEFKVEGFESVIKGLDDYGQKMQQRTPEAVHLAAYDFQGMVQGYAPVDTGKYRTTIHVNPSTEISENTFADTVETEDIRACQLEFGGTITAKNGPYLTFQIDGHWVRVHEVHQSGKPHFRPAIDEFRQKYPDIMVGLLGDESGGDWIFEPVR